MSIEINSVRRGTPVECYVFRGGVFPDKNRSIGNAAEIFHTRMSLEKV